MTSIGWTVNRLETQSAPLWMNAHIQTVIVAPMTTKSRAYPIRIACTFDGHEAWIVLDQIGTIDRQRLVKQLGGLDRRTQQRVLAGLAELFAE